MSPQPMKHLQALEEILGFTFKEPKLAQQAFVHRSYLNEHPSFPLGHNERLEFLGDAVLELVVTEYLYKQYPQSPEGELTNWRASLVNAKMLSMIAQGLGLEQFLLLSRGESKDRNSRARLYILANVIEAVIGAMYLDQGMSVCRRFIEEHVLNELPKILETKSYLDPKSRFQERSQEKLGITPRYQVLEESGPDHNKHFRIGVYLDKELVATGEGMSKQEAQIRAAEAGLEEKGWS